MFVIVKHGLEYPNERQKSMWNVSEAAEQIHQVEADILKYKQEQIHSSANTTRTLAMLDYIPST